MEKEKKEKEVEKEEKTTKQKESKGIKTTSFQTTLIVILLICVAALGGWIVGASKVNVMYKEAINSKESAGEKKTTPADNNTTNDNNTSNDTTTPEVKDEIKPLDLNKSLNTTGINYSDPKELSDGREEIGVSVKNNDGLKLAINWPKFGPYSTASAWSDTTIEYDITNLSGTVKEGIVAGVGQDSVGTTVFYLMNDGTVEYTRMFKKTTDNSGHTYYVMNYTYEKESDGKITGQHFESEGKVSGAKDVIKLYSVNASSGHFGHVTVLGATKDGSFYDLGNAIHFE